MNPTAKAIQNNDLEQLKALRQQGKLEYSEMSTLAIYKKLDLLKTLYQWAREDEIKEIKVPAFTEPFEKYVNCRVLIYLIVQGSSSSEKKSQCFELLNYIRQHQSLNYTRLLSRVLTESRSKHDLDNLQTLIQMAKEDKAEAEIDWQKLLQLAFMWNQHIEDELKILKDAGEQAGVHYDWQAIADELVKERPDLRLLLKWTDAVQIDYQAVLERLPLMGSSRDQELVKFYLDRAILESQELDYGKLLDLFESESIQKLIHEYLPLDYQLPTYDETMTINVDEQTSLMDDLIRYTYATTELKKVSYQGRDYYERSSSWGGYSPHQEGVVEPRPDYDPDVECSGYMDGCELTTCEEIPPTIHPTNQGDIEYHLSVRPKDIHWNDDRFDEANHKTIRHLQRVDPTKVQLVGSSILLINNRGINHDHRGSDHCQLDLGFCGCYMVQTPCVLMDFMKACYRIKSHHWDKWYELYGGCDNIEKSGDCLMCNVGFDHGS